VTTQKRLPISVCMIAGNEAQRIRSALESVAGWTAEIVVVINDDVVDGTDKIAESFGAKVFREPWKGHIAQKNSAEQKTSKEWILGLDADEIISTELRNEIQELFSAPEKLKPFAAFSFPRLTFYCGRWIRHGDWYPDRQTRLWQCGAAEWGGVDPHDKLLVRGKIAKLRRNLLHHNAESIDKQIQKISSYSNDFLRNAAANERRNNWLDLAFRPVWRFARSYFFRLGFLDGWQGCYIAWMTAFYTATRYAKVLNEQKKAGNP
jgi:glycosyltransferase involved in cell wall biosynthesis